MEITSEFQKMWQFPHCLGAIGGKHIRMLNPDNSGSLWFNFKKFYSMVLMTVAGARSLFLLVDVGAYGHISDGSMLNSSQLGGENERWITRLTGVVRHLGIAPISRFGPRQLGIPSCRTQSRD